MQVIEPNRRVEFPTREQAEAYALAVGGEVAYTFDELDDKAKDKARLWYCSAGLDHDWWDGVYEMATTAGKCLGIDVKAIEFEGFWSQGNGARFKGSYTYKKGWRADLKAEFGPGDTLVALERIGEALQDIQRPVFYKLEAGVRMDSRYMATYVDVDDYGLTDRQWAMRREADVRDEMRSFAHWIYKSLEQEYDYLTSDEAMRESIEANGYLFTEEGGPIN